MPERLANEGTVDPGDERCVAGSGDDYVEVGRHRDDPSPHESQRTISLHLEYARIGILPHVGVSDLYLGRSAWTCEVGTVRQPPGKCLRAVGCLVDLEGIHPG